MLLCLVAVVVIGGWVRYMGIDFGLPAKFARPDEELITEQVHYMLERGTYRPSHLIYPSFFIYLNVAVGKALSPLVPDSETAVERFEYIYMTGRCVSAALGTLTLLLVFLLGRRAYSTRIGLMAALVLALLHLHVRDSHFGVTDVGLGFFATLALLPIIQTARTGSWKHVLLSGVCAGLAFGMKYTGLVMLAPLALALWLHFFPQRAFKAMALRFTAACAVTAFFFALTTPYGVLEPDRLLHALRFQQSVATTEQADLFDRGLIWNGLFTLRYGMGILLCLAAAVGLIFAFIRRKNADLIVASYFLIYYICIGLGRLIFVRYMVPVAPVLAVLAVVGIDRMSTLIWNRKRVALAWGLTVLALIIPAVRAIRSDLLLAKEDTRIVAARYLVDHVGEDEKALLIGRYALPARSLCKDSRFVIREAHDLSVDDILSEPYDYVVYSTYFFDCFFDPDAEMAARLEQELEPVRIFSPLKQGIDRDAIDPVFNDQDIFYLPFARFDGFERGGPFIHVRALND